MSIDASSRMGFSSNLHEALKVADIIRPTIALFDTQYNEIAFAMLVDRHETEVSRLAAKQEREKRQLKAYLDSQ